MCSFHLYLFHRNLVKFQNKVATPHVAGVALLLWNKFPGCTNAQIRNALQSSAKDLGDPGRDDWYGHGAVRYWAAYNFLNAGYGCAGPPPTPAPLPPRLRHVRPMTSVSKS